MDRTGFDGIPIRLARRKLSEHKNRDGGGAVRGSEEDEFGEALGCVGEGREDVAVEFCGCFEVRDADSYVAEHFVCLFRDGFLVV